MLKAVITYVLLLTGGVSGYNQPTCRQGTVIVHLFNWKWTNIADECESFLGPKGFCGVQVSPPNEHAVIDWRPWWERYQPVSYILESRSGGRDQFIDMVRRCNAVNVGIYVDMVVNHMTGSGSEGHGSGGSWHSAPNLDFPGVPFGPNDFNCCNCHMCSSHNCEINDYGNVDEVRNCRLVSLVDLALGNDYVRQKVADFFNDLIGIGVAGFRVDACKHMWPGDISATYSRVSNLNTEWWPGGTQPFIFNEVIDRGGEPISAGEYTHLGRVTEFRYCDNIARAFRGDDGTNLSHLKNFGQEWGMLADGDALVFVDNHDNQRGHGGGGSAIITHKEHRLYKMATAFKLAWPYGFVRIMSSFYFDDSESSPPSHGDGSLMDVIINPDGSCGNGWTCEHRWRQITNMAMFRNYGDWQPVSNWWDNGGNQIAFSRGDKAFIAINNDWGDLDMTLSTGLPEGTYCDIISGDPSEFGCSGGEVYVDGGGQAHIFISSGAEDPMVAIHEGSRSRSGRGGGTLGSS